MKQHLVFSLIGADRPGLVDRITAAITAAGGNLEDSRMAVLGGEFAMIMLCTAEGEGAAGLEQAVRGTAGDLEMLVTCKPTTPRAPLPGTVPLAVHVRGADHEGIVHDIVHHLMERGASVATLDSQVTPAPHSGTPLFSMSMRVEAPASVSLAGLRRSLEDVAEPLNVDVEVEPVTP